MRERELLEGKHSETVDMWFPFVAGFVDRATGYGQSAPMKTVQTIYTEFVNRLIED